MEMPNDASPGDTDPRELFDRGLELFTRGAAEESVAALREAFFGNLHIAPLLLGMEVAPDAMAVPGPCGTAEAAREYVRAARPRWQAVPHGLRYLRCLWNDPLVRREIRSYGNLCKSFARAQGNARLAEFAAEREKFTNLRRIRSTEKEILERVRQFRFDLPPPLPRACAVTIASRAADDLAAFLSRVLGFAPAARKADGARVFAFQGLELCVVAGEEESHAGCEIAFRVADFDYYALRLEDEEITPCEASTGLRRERFLVLALPGGLRLRLIGGPPGAEAHS
ncbi:MAG TPA: hypothetical protein DCM87_12840 [Planctomycetes bacterium]|nr:hypothetical protein [Planctomycetota bacterium]